MTTLRNNDPALCYLRQYAGYSEAEMLAHSPEWISARATEVNERRNEEFKATTATHIQATALAVGAGMGSKEAADSLNDWLEELTAQPGDDDHFLDPNAQTDMEGLRRSGMVQPASGVANG